MLRGGAAAFQMETGSWQGVKREYKVCKECNSGEVEDAMDSLGAQPGAAINSHCWHLPSPA